MIPPCRMMYLCIKLIQIHYLGGQEMTRYREILRLHAMGLSQRNIAHGCSASKTTVNRVIKRADELGLSWPLDDNQTDGVLAKILFPPPTSLAKETARRSDFRTSPTSAMNYSRTVSARSFCGQNTWRNVG